MTVEQNTPAIVAAITQDAQTRAKLARQLPGDSVLLFFPDSATAARTLAESMPEVLADVHEETAPALSYGGLVIDSLRLEVTWDGTLVQLTKLERQLLSCLATSPIRAWPYEDLYRAVWREAWLGDTSALHATVKRLRRKLTEAGVTVTLEAVRGVGFRLVAEATRSWRVNGAHSGAVVGGDPGLAHVVQPVLADVVQEDLGQAV